MNHSVAAASGMSWQKLLVFSAISTVGAIAVTELFRYVRDQGQKKDLQAGNVPLVCSCRPASELSGWSPGGALPGLRGPYGHGY